MKQIRLSKYNIYLFEPVWSSMACSAWDTMLNMEGMLLENLSQSQLSTEVS